MQANKYIQHILKKYILNQCNEQEIKEVIDYFQNIKNSNQIPSVKEVLELLDEKPVMAIEDANRIHNNILEKFKPQQNKPKRKPLYFWRYAAAAVLVGILTTSYFLKDNLFNKPVEQIPTIVNTIESTIIEPGTDKATLTLEDGSNVALEKGGTFQTQNAKSNGEELIYGTDNEKIKEVVYNYLTIPRGGQFHVILEDGTEVWLNSESQLKYPVSFIEGETRVVELVYGEAYFDVSPSTEHKGSKFKVFNKSQEVEVFGTEFNIKAYKDETKIYTTLVEGKVAINANGQQQYLNPSQQSNLDVSNKNIAIAKVDVHAETSWRNGIFSFKQKSLKEIMKVISRWYDVNVIFENKELEDIKFKGVLGKNQNLDELLLTIKTLSIIKNYEINDKTITLK